MLQNTENTAGVGGHLTTLPLHEAAAQASQPLPVRPEFVRLPKPGILCAWTGLSRSKLNELILPCAGNSFRPPVSSKVLRKSGAVRGVRLIILESLLAHLRSLPDGAGHNQQGGDV